MHVLVEMCIAGTGAFSLREYLCHSPMFYIFFENARQSSEIA